jgi:hypothetical protein
MARYSTNDNPSVVIRDGKFCVYKVPGTYTWTVPASVTCATFELRGSGGGGGAKCCCECYHQGFGGTAGNYSTVTLPVTPGDQYTLVVPSGGGTNYIGAEGSHWCCFGGGGAAAYVTGPGITTLCAGGGLAGNNDCYQHCLCSNCCGFGTLNNCVNISATNCSFISKPMNYCNEVTAGTTAGGCKYSLSWVGLWNDSQSQYYPTAAGSATFGSGFIRPQDHCSNPTVNACTNCSLAGLGGTGSIWSGCNCYQAGTGRHGQITIRY